MRNVWLIAAACLLMGFFIGCSNNPEGNSGSSTVKINLVGFSILEPTIKDMMDDWTAWRSLNWLSSVNVQSRFGSSVEITSELLNQKGQGVEVAILGSDGDRKQLERAGLAGERNRKLAKFGVVAMTPVVIVVRKDNPNNIHEFIDLTRPNLKIISADPQKSSLGQWSIIAFYEAIRHNNLDDEELAKAALSSYQHNIVKLFPSAHQTLQAMKDGQYDAFIAYEADALEFIKSEASGELTSITPSTTMMCEFVICIMDTITDEKKAQAAEDFVAYLYTTAGQKVWARHYFNSPLFTELNPPTRYAKVKTMLQIDALGGFEQTKKDIVDGIWSKL